ncbi:hypothetical protein J3A64_001784 [Pseudarthrobacter sp. PvP004]|nr:hypothetical protein [Pseudarthrobacter sp. PvP004]
MAGKRVPDPSFVVRIRARADPRPWPHYVVELAPSFDPWITPNGTSLEPDQIKSAVTEPRQQLLLSATR